MAIRGSNPLATLRRRRRPVVAALLPALLLWVTTTSSCLAMAQAAPSHDASAEQAMHAAHGVTMPGHVVPGTPCPHCPAGSTTMAPHAGCTTATNTTLGKLAGEAPTAAMPVLPASSWLPPPATPAPPLIVVLGGSRVRETVPLNIRHCVLLI